MALTPEWYKRIKNWKNELKNCFYKPLLTVPAEAFFTFDQLSLAEAKKQSFSQIEPETPWGKKWEYMWLKGSFSIPTEASGKRIVLRVNNHVKNDGGEGIVYLNGTPAGAVDWAHPELTLATSARGNEKFEMFTEIYAGHGHTYIFIGPLAQGRQLDHTTSDTQKKVGVTSVNVWNEEAFQLWHDVETLFQIREKLDANCLRQSEIDKGLRDFTTIVDLEGDDQHFHASILAARNRLQPLLACVNGSTAPLMFTFGHAHIDVAWLWPLAETERKMVRTMSTQLALIKEYPEYRFLQSQPHLYQMIKTKYPEFYAEVKKKIVTGEIQPEGGMWVEADTNLSGGEALIRQFIHGKRFFKTEFGVDSKLLWLPDVFGYSGSLPQIMAGCGIDYFASAKIFWAYNGGEQFPYNTFYWEGIDGTKIPTHLMGFYGSMTNPEEIYTRWNECVQKDGISTRMMPFGNGDGGGGATRTHLEFLRRSHDLEGLPRCTNQGPVDFFKDLEKRGIPDVRYVGELYFQAHRGTYTSQARTKKGNRKSEFGLREAEMWLSAAHALAGHPIPADEMDRIWKLTLLNQFHDIIPGSSIERVYTETEAMHKDVISSAAAIAQKACSTLTLPSKDCVTIFNSLNWSRNALVELPETFTGLKDTSGSSLPVQIFENKVLTIVPLPSCGWSVFSKTASVTPASAMTATKASIENELLRIILNEFGEITSIFDKENNIEFAAGPCNSFKMYQDISAEWEAWDIDSTYKNNPVQLTAKADISVIAQGPLMAGLRVKRVINNSTLTQNIVLTRTSKQIEFKTRIDWHENHKLLKVCFPVNIQTHEALHEIQFGHVKRPNHLSRQFDADRFEVSNHKWSLLADENRGVAVLNDCKYGLNVAGNSINLTLLKAAMGPDPTADRGIQEFTYALLPYTGSFADSPVVRAAYELNAPVQMIYGAAKQTEQSLFSIDRENIIIEALKPAEDRTKSCVVRLYEAKRMSVNCNLTINLPVKKAFITNMLEENAEPVAMNNNMISLSFKPFEIKTLKLVF